MAPSKRNVSPAELGLPVIVTVRASQTIGWYRSLQRSRTYSLYLGYLYLGYIG